MTLNTDIYSFKDIYLFIFLFWPYRGGMWDLSSTNQGLSPHPLQWKHRVLATGPAGKFLDALTRTLLSACALTGRRSSLSLLAPTGPLALISSLLSPGLLASSPISLSYASR